MKRTIITLLATAALTLPAMAQSGQRDSPRYSDERAATTRGKIIGNGYRERYGDRDFDRRRGSMNRDFDRRHRGYAFSRTYRERLGPRSARNRSYGQSRSSRY
jgi:hypothetical protein